MDTLPQTTNPQQWAAVFTQFAQHFAQTGERVAYFRSLMRALTPPSARIVELGAGSNPLFDRATFPNYRNIDYYSDTEIIAHFRNDYKDDVASMQFAPVDYVCKDGNYAGASPRNLFDAFSHSIRQNLSRKLPRSEPVSFDQSLRTAYQAYLEARAGTRDFQDFHNWVFTSESLKLIVLELYQVGPTGLLPVYVLAPVGNEFFCVLAKAEKPDADVSDAILQVLKQIHLSD